MNVALSTHATVRAKQRGVPHHLIDALVANADFEAPIGSGCTVLRMSRARLEDPDLVATLGAERERLRGLSVIWSDRTSEIVTILRPRRGAVGRRYRRGA
jgi:hypothetical protein